MHAGLLALMLAQAAPTQVQVIGSLNTLQAAVEEARAGTRTYSQNAAKTRLCIDPAGGTIQAGSVTLRYGVAILTPLGQRYLGFSLPSYAASWDEVLDEYVAFETQAPAASTVTFNPAVFNANLDVIGQEVEVRASPAYPTCEIAIVRRDDALYSSVVKCACRVNSTCLVGGSAAPQGRTLSPGTWSGAGCQPKSCFARFDGIGVDGTWPANCPH